MVKFFPERTSIYFISFIYERTRSSLLSFCGSSFFLSCFNFFLLIFFLFVQEERPRLLLKEILFILFHFIYERTRFEHMNVDIFEDFEYVEKQIFKKQEKKKELQSKEWVRDD